MTKEKELIIVSRLQAKQNCEGALGDELKSLADATRSESGCLSYAIHRDINNAAVFILIQRWKSKEDLDIHFITPHFLQHSLMLATLITAPPVITYLEEIE
jgi:quinol monooxygenase YgiN